MTTWLLVVTAVLIAALTIVGYLSITKLRPQPVNASDDTKNDPGKISQSTMEVMLREDSLPDPRRQLAGVFLPEHPRKADIEKVNFSLAAFGYRVDQVDEVLAALAQEIEDKDRELRELKKRGASSAAKDGSRPQP